MASDAFQNPQPGRRPDREPPGARRPGERRPLQRAGTWTREHWRATRDRLAGTHLPKPSRKALTWTGAILGLLAIAIAILIAVWDWNWFRGPLARAASARMHRQVTIDGNLHVHLFSWQPSASVEGVHIANPKWAGKGNMADVGRIALRIRLIPLLGGHLDMRLLEFDRANVRMLRDAQGRASWDFSDGKKPEQPMRLPPINNFIINDGQIAYHDVKRKLTFTGTLNARERLGGQNHGFEMRGQGTLNTEPFTLAVTGGPLLNVNRDKPYPFDAEIRAGATYVTAKGAVPKPFDLGVFHMDATARGPDLADLYAVTGIPLPNTPPYSVRGRISRNENNYRVSGISGRVGSSDLSGEISAKTGGARPFVQANLLTRNLDFPDLGALFGGAAHAGKVASPNQKAAAKVLQAKQHLLPDATLKVDRIRSVDADVTYKALTIRNAPVHLSSGSARVRLNAGLLTADPVAFQLPQGRLSGSVALDARKATPVTSLDLRLANARLEDVVPVHLGGGQPFTGSFVGRARLTGTGDSVHKAFANANGQLTFAVPSGEIRRSFAELMGVDVVKGLGLLLSKNQESTPIRCGVADFRAQNGVFTADHFVVDTGPVLVAGSGSVNMDSETLDLRAQGHPKKFQLVHLKVPVTAQGPLLHPKLGVQPGPAIAQGGAAAALGVFLTPLAAILPFIDAGLTKDANCSALIGEAAHAGAPVKAAHPRVAAR